MFGCTDLLAEPGILRTQAWRHGSRAWGITVCGGRPPHHRTTTTPSIYAGTSATGPGRPCGRARCHAGRVPQGLVLVGFPPATGPGRTCGRARCHARRAAHGPGAGRAHCVLLSPSRASGPQPVRPRAPGRHLGRSLARWIPPALRSAGNRRQSPEAHGCCVRAGAVACVPPGAPSLSGASSRDGPVLRAHLGRRRCAGSPGVYRVPQGSSSAGLLSLLSQSCSATRARAALSAGLAARLGAGRSSWADHRAGPLWPLGSLPFHRCGD